MNLSEFDYQLPRELIARYPRSVRDESKLMVVDRADNSLTHRIFRDITDYLREGDVMVLNDTKVMPCRLKGFRATGGKVEFLLLKHLGGMTFSALVRPSRLKRNEQVRFMDTDMTAALTGRNEVSFVADSIEAVYSHGVMPIPPYIKRDAEDMDKEYYQTVYAAQEGSVAAPTAGLHFTLPLLTRIRNKGVDIAFLTLHVGQGTFKAVTAEDITAHTMDKEYFRIGEEAKDLIERARRRHGRIIAVGTTSCRVLETYAQGMTQGYSGLFIYPGYRFRLTDCLLTNFHLPRTTLLMLVSAFTGNALRINAYRAAIETRYRFYSYGDAMLIL